MKLIFSVVKASNSVGKMLYKQKSHSKKAIESIISDTATPMSYITTTYVMQLFLLVGIAVHKVKNTKAHIFHLA